MKLVLKKNQLNITSEQFLRKAGYAYIRSRYDNTDSFVRRLTRSHYPRLHIHIKEIDDKVCFNLHLDQKKPSYPGVKMHNAEHEGKIIEEEIKRLKDFAGSNLDKIEQKDSLEKEIKEQKSWWKKNI